MVKVDTYSDYCARVEQAARFVYSNLDRSVSVAELADLACMSPYHFQRVFKRVSGEKVGHFARRLRLEKAAWRLQNTNDSISEIAIDAGFESLEPFARAFRTEYGSSASEFRESKWLTYVHSSANQAHFVPTGEMEFVPLGREGCSALFSVETVAVRRVAARPHHGSPHLIGKSTLEFWSEVQQLGLDPRRDPLISYSPKLTAGMPVAEVKTFVGTDSELVSTGDFIRQDVGGGDHLVVLHFGDMRKLGDFWFRIWAEIMPASGAKQRPGFVFQVGRLIDGGSTGETTIYIPVFQLCA